MPQGYALTAAACRGCDTARTPTAESRHAHVDPVLAPAGHRAAGGLPAPTGAEPGKATGTPGDVARNRPAAGPRQGRAENRGRCRCA
ncbi:hypothetical protein G6F57_016588 [Rhizopus arrhizus]|nr:hypothetical protein G6F22_014326 [Rhizopus arrhizus]KAG1271118.1 hypothetical protein G6F65_012624 [Rhizopus arrhizus]KAG1449586.1 hypothetical protein G6F57_016588 [Rhizopus arrhizus]